MLTPDFRERAVRSVAAAAFEESSPSSMSFSTYKCKTNCENCCTFDLCTSKKSRTPNLSPESHVASKQGFKMMRKFLYPGMPKILQDLWVLAEVAITLTQFVLAVTNLSFEPTEVFNIIYLTITCIGLFLALLDAFLHFIQLGSCAATIKYFRKKQKRRKSLSTQASNDEEQQSSCLRISKKRKEQIAEVLDFIRNWITDIILYPLVILDLYDVITAQSYYSRTAQERVDFSIFIIGVIFLVLSVYVARIVMIITAAINFYRLPTDSSDSHKKVYKMALWFILHVFAQTIVHASIFFSIGANVHLENIQTESGSQILILELLLTFRVLTLKMLIQATFL